MAKKYFWLKLKFDWFDSKVIKKLRRIAGGDTYTIIYLKMQLLSLKNEGKLYYEGVEENFIDELALDLDEDTENVKVTMQFLQNCGLIEMTETDEYMLTEVPSSIGCETEDAERKRRSRANINRKRLEEKTGQCHSHVTTCHTEIEKELEKELERKSEKVVDNKLSTYSKTQKRQPNAFDYAVVQEIIKSCIEVFPNSVVPCKESAITKWAVDIEKMRRMDNRTEDEIKEALRYAVTDGFWKSNIRSSKKFREKFETLIVQSRGQKRNSPVIGTQAFADRARRWAEND